MTAPPWPAPVAAVPAVPATPPTLARLSPYPIVTVDGADVAGVTSAPLTVLDGLTVDWGRKTVLARGEGSTATFRLFDPTGAWLTGRRLLDLPVSVRWAAPGYTAPAGEPTSPVIFRGRIAAAPVRRHLYRDPTGAKVHGLVALVTCSGPQVDLANRQVNVAAGFPVHTLAQRIAAVLPFVDGSRGAYPAQILTGIQLRTYWQAATVPAVSSVTNQPVSSILGAIADSLGGDQLVYEPNTRAMISVPRRAFTTWTTTAGVGVTAGPNLTGVSSRVTLDGRPEAEGVGLPAGELLEPDELWSEDPANQVSVINFGYNDQNANDSNAVEFVATSDPRPVERPLNVTTMHRWNAYLRACEDDVTAQVFRGEARHVQLAPLVLDTGRVGGFPSPAAARLLLAGYERPGVVFVTGSLLARYGIRPVFSIIGGRMEYAAGGWRVTAAISPVDTGTTAQAGVTWPGLVAAAQQTAYPATWTTTRPRPDQFALDPTMTYADARHLGYGLGAASAQPEGPPA